MPGPSKQMPGPSKTMGICALLVGDRRRNEGSWIGWAFVFDGLGLRFDGVGLCFGWAGVFVVAQKTKARMREYRGQNEGGSRPE